MRAFLAWLYGAALALGGPGLFAVAALDSSFISLPQINDLLVVLMVTQNKALMLYYAAMATLGSVVGCYVIYYLAGKGGEAFLKKRTRAGALERTLALYRRHGLLALMIPALLPPPAPFKLFVILAGVARISLTKFIVAVAIGRGIRYFAEGLLAVWYGERALEFMRVHGREVSLWFGLAVLGLGLLYVVWRARTRAAKPSEAH